MGRYILKINDYYLEWSTIVDAPVTFGMKLEDFEAYYRNEYGEAGFRDFETRIERVERAGTSNLIGLTLEEVITANRAGPDETELSLNEIYQAYCLQEPIRGDWIVP